LTRRTDPRGFSRCHCQAHSEHRRPRCRSNPTYLPTYLPTSIAEGTETDKIYHVITNIQGPNGDAWSTFNRRFDILFKEDAQCRDADGRLHLIRRGELGMTMVARYLRDIKWNAVEMNLDGAVGKLERLVKEMEYLKCVILSEDSNH
jgi:hypothetical protein